MTHGTIRTPWPLVFRRVRFQFLPILTVLASATLAGWIWASQAHSAVGTGEVEAIRVMIECKSDGVLEPLPRPVNVFDAVTSGQVVARLDTRAAEAELRRLEEELSQLESGATTAPSVAHANASVEWYRARIDQLNAKIDAKDLKAPIAGIITEIHKRPGEGIIGFFRQDQVRPAPGAPVQIQSRTRSGATYRSYVQSVGAQVELLPSRHWRNPQVQEWGLPVQIAMPKDADLKPGETVDLVMKPAN
jgi:multidrug resistance efflux pump